MKILLIHGKFLPIYNKGNKGAIEKLERIYLEHNEEIGNEITAYTPKIAIDNFDKKNLEYTTFRTISLISKKYKILKPYYAIKHRFLGTHNNEYYIREVIKDIKRRGEQNKYDLILFENEEASIPLFKQKTKTKTPIVLHLHNDYVNKDRKLSEKIIDSCNEIWCVSKYLQQRILEVKDAKTVVVPNTIEKQGDIDVKIVKELQKDFDVKNQIIYLFIGRLLPVKGVEELVDSFNSACRKRNDIRLILIGGFDDSRNGEKFKTKILRKIKDNNQITLAGYKQPNELAIYYNIADYQIIPSKWNEPFGLVVLEAMQANLGIITTGTGGISEACEDKAIYISKDNIRESLEEALLNIDRKNSLPENYYVELLEKYSMENFNSTLDKNIKRIGAKK